MSKTTMLRRALPCLFALLALGCDDDAERPLPNSNAARPLSLDNGLFYTFDDPDGPAGSATGNGAALTLDLSAAKPKVSEFELPSGLTRALQRPAHPGEVVVLTSGHDQYRDGKEVVNAENGRLSVFTRAGLALEVPLGTSFNNFVLSDDGRFAVAYAPSGNNTALNSLEVIDLDRSAPGLPVSRLFTLGFDGRAPTSLTFSPAAAFTRRLVVAAFPDAIQLVDLEHPENGEISIPLKAATDARTLQPQKLLFFRDSTPNVPERIYVQSTGSNQVMVIELIAAAETRQGFRPAQSFVTAAGAITDLAITGSGDGLRLLVLANGLEILDPKVGDSLRVESARGFASLLAFQGKSPADTQAGQRALLYQVGQPRVGFVDIESQSSWSSRSVEPVELGEPLSALLPLQKHKLVLALHSGQRFSIIDLEQRRVTPIQLETTLASYLLDETDQVARLWTANSSGLVGVLDLVSLKRTPISIALDARSNGPGLDEDERSNVTAMRPSNIVLVPGTPRRVALVHPATSGRITLLNADFNPDDAEATLAPRELTGFLLSALFD